MLSIHFLSTIVRMVKQRGFIHFSVVKLKALGLPFALALHAFMFPVFASGTLRDIGLKKYAVYKAHMINFRRFEYLNFFPQTRNVEVYCASANSAYQIFINYRQYLEEVAPEVDFEGDKKELFVAVSKC